MTAEERIVRDPHLLGGNPLVRGTRISVDHVLGMLTEGTTEAQIRHTYPRLKADDVRDASSLRLRWSSASILRRPDLVRLFAGKNSRKFGTHDGSTVSELGSTSTARPESSLTSTPRASRRSTVPPS